MSRRNARENAFKLLFSTIARQEAPLPQELFDEAGDEEVISGKHISEEGKSYIQSVYDGVLKHIKDLDECISMYLKNWQIDRINRVCLASLRLCFYEIQYMDDIPFRVSASETVEIVKKYAGEEEAKFVNGVLGEYIRREIEPKETKQD